MAGRTSNGPVGQLRSLALACHPGPTVAVTALTTALAAGAGNSAAKTVLVALAVLTGQLSIGWSNDWVDAARDRAVARSDKPVAAGLLSVSAVRTAAFAALAGTLVLSATLGWRAGLVHLVAVVASGWAYNLGLKNTFWSWLPYLICFGLLPAVVTLPLPAHPIAAGWAIAAGALLGFGAHLANVLPDLEADRVTGVRGLPHRLRRTPTALLAPLALLGATLSVVVGPAGAPSVLGWCGLAVSTGLAVGAAVSALRSAASHLPFQLTIAVAAVDVALLISVGSQLGR